MNIVDFFRLSNQCTSPECPACARMERTLATLAESLPTLEELDAAMEAEDNAPAGEVLDKIHAECQTLLSAAALLACYATSNKHRLVNAQLAGHLFTLSLARAVKAVGLPIPVAVTSPLPEEVQAELDKVIAASQPEPTKH